MTAQVVDRLVHSLRRSTLAVYDSEWRRWFEWCTARGVPACDPSVPTLMPFFTALFRAGLPPDTVGGYRPSINSVLEVFGQQDKVGDPLFRAYRLDRPWPRTLFPAWDLSLVLRSLMVAPYAPLGPASLEILSVEAVFLLAFALCARHGHELGRVYDLSRGYSTVIFDVSR